MSRRLVRNAGYDELAEARAAELDEIIEQLAVFADPPPAKVNVMFESLLVAYAALAARRGEKRTILLGAEAYRRAEQTGLLAWCAAHYPHLSIEGPRKSVRGCHASLVILDEAAQMP